MSKVDFAALENVDPFFDIFGSTVTVYLSTSTALGKEINVILDAGESLGIQSPDAPGSRMSVVVRATDIPAPNYRDRFVIRNSSDEDENWYLTENVAGGVRIGTWDLTLTRSTRRWA